MADNNEQFLLKRINKMKNPVSITEFMQLDGFSAIKKAVKMPKEDILNEIIEANLRGRGGAAYPAGRKWKQLYEINESPKYIVCNADEGEPGTFKDKVLLSKDPFSVIEGMLIAGYLFGSENGFIYIRGEYRDIQKTFQNAINEAVKAGFLGNNIMGIEGFNYTITIISGSGAYVCGENSALLNSIEGKAGRPRVKPPHLAEVGLYLKPTLVNNVETFACIPLVINLGGTKFLELGTIEGGGTKLISLSGHSKNRGVYEVKLGTPIHDILYSEEYGGGTSTGNPIKFCHLGGQSGPIGYIDQLNERVYSYEDLWNNDLAVGSGAIVVMDDTVSSIEYLKSVAEFFVHESCGKCTPCRLGTTRLLELLNNFSKKNVKKDDIKHLETLVNHITNLSACGLGQSVGVAIKSSLKYSRKEFEECIK